MQVLHAWWPTLLYTILLLALAIMAALYSSRTGKLCAWVCLAEQGCTLGFRLTVDYTLVSRGHALIAMFAVDLIASVILLWISSETRQRWPLLLATAQALTVSGRLARLVDPTIWPLATWIMVNWTASPIAAIATVGAWLDRRRAFVT